MCICNHNSHDNLNNSNDDPDVPEFEPFYFETPEFLRRPPSRRETPERRPHTRYEREIPEIHFETPEFLRRPPPSRSETPEYRRRSPPSPPSPPSRLEILGYRRRSPPSTPQTLQYRRKPPPFRSPPFYFETPEFLRRPPSRRETPERRPRYEMETPEFHFETPEFLRRPPLITPETPEHWRTLPRYREDVPRRLPIPRGLATGSLTESYLPYPERPRKAYTVKLKNVDTDRYCQEYVKEGGNAHCI